MAFADNKPRTILQGYFPVKVTLAEAVVVGDLIAYNSGWKLAGAATATEVLVAGESGAIGDVITAYPAAYISGSTGGTGGAEIIAAASGAYDEGTTGQKVGISLSATTFYVGPLLVPTAIT